MERIYEKAAETAKKIRKALKTEFPGIKFSVTSSTFSMGSSVHVSWTDGPMENQVDAVISQFESSSFDGMQDLSTTHGYIYEGQLYVGAKYVQGQRNLSPEYRAKLEEEAAAYYGDWNKDDYYAGSRLRDTEKRMLGLDKVQDEIQEAPQDNEPEFVESAPETESASSNVIPFTRIAEKKAENLFDGLCAEQRLKLSVLSQIVGQNEVATLISTQAMTIDDLFVLAAQKIYATK